jgi:hypothetical protein
MIGVLGFDSWRGLGIFLFTTASRTALGPTQPPIQWVLGALSLGVKRSGREAEHSPPSSAKIKNAWSYTSALQYVFMVWYLVKHRDNFTFTLIILSEQYVSWKLALHSTLNCPLTSRLLSPNIFLSTSFSLTCNLCSSLRTGDHFHNYTTQLQNLLF